MEHWEEKTQETAGLRNYGQTVGEDGGDKEKVGGHVKSKLEKMEVTRSFCCTRSFH